MNHIGSILTDHSTSIAQPQQNTGFYSPPTDRMDEQTYSQFGTHQQSVAPQPPLVPHPIQPSSNLDVGDPATPPAPVMQSKTTRETIDVKKIKDMVAQMKLQLATLEHMLGGVPTQSNTSLSPTPHTVHQETPAFTEGVFNGTAMIGADGKEYPVSPNYASKSKLVEGDLMKMTVAANGMLRFKQIGPIARKHAHGEVLFDPNTKQWSVLSEGRAYKILTAAITFHKAEAGDEATIIVPEDGESSWAAMERVTKKIHNTNI